MELGLSNLAASSLGELSPIYQVDLPVGGSTAHYQIVDYCARYNICPSEYAINTAYSVNDYIFHNSFLYRVTGVIAKGDNTGWSVPAVANNVLQVTIVNEINLLRSQMANPMHYLGTTSTVLVDGSTTATITIIGKGSITLDSDDAGSIVIYDNKEFIWNGSSWNEFGSTGALKAFAFVDEGITAPIPVVTSASVHIDDLVGNVTQRYISGTASAPTVSPVNDSKVTVLTSVTASTGIFMTDVTKHTAAAVTGIGAAETGAFVTGLNTPSTATAMTGPETALYRALAVATATFVASLKTTTEAVATSASTGSFAAVSALTSIKATKITSFGTAASWSAVVSNGVLSFTWTANSIATGTEVTAHAVTTAAMTVVTAVNTKNITYGYDVQTGDITYAYGLTATDTNVKPATNGLVVSLVQGSTSGAFVTGYTVATATAIKSMGTVSTATVLTNITKSTGVAVTSVATGGTAAIPTSFTAAAPGITLALSTESSTGAVQAVTAVTTKSDDKSVTISTTNLSYDVSPKTSV